MRTRIALLALIVASAAPPTPDDATREANAAVAREDFPLAERLYAEASGRSTDPGLIAFNQGVVLARRGQFGEAEKLFRRCLDDADAPADRRAKGWYNLGNCLLRRSGSVEVGRLRTAIECYRRCLASEPGEPLRADATYNLELAKTLWTQARSQEARPDDPNDEPREMENLPDPKRPESKSDGPGDDPQGKGNQGKADPKTNGTAPKDVRPRPTEQPTPGAGKLPVLPDADVLVPLTPEEATQYLRDAAERLKNERRNQSRLASPGERPDARNW